MRLTRFANLLTLTVLLCALSVLPCFAQTETATISGRITDVTGAIVLGAAVQLRSADKGTVQETTTNDSGIYVFPVVHPGVYNITVRKQGFKQVDSVGLTANVQAHIEQNFALTLGAVSESITVNGSAVGQLDTESATVSTVVDSQFVENLPLNGRSFQSLIYLQPGVVSYANGNGIGNASFSTNGVRTNSNYFSIDGVSANIGTTTFNSFGFSSGTQLGGDAVGGTNGLISVDAMQEFRMQTSSFAPEFGRTPGAQVSITSKSGSNKWHGTAYDYLRNDFFDARNYFDFAQTTTITGVPYPALPKPALRQNDFGGSISGPIWKDKTFFFFSYEHDKLLQPTLNGEYFLNAASRANTSPLWAPWINSSPLPPANAPYSTPFGDPNTSPTPVCDNGNPANANSTNQPGDIPCIQLYAVGQSNPSNSVSYSLRLDHNLTSKLTLFARIVHSPSTSDTLLYNNSIGSAIKNDTVTAGLTYTISPTMVNDLRANWSRATNATIETLSNGFGAVAFPAGTELLPPGSGWTTSNALSGICYYDYSDPNGHTLAECENVGVNKGAGLRQWNIVDDLSRTIGSHQLKFGLDWRLLVPDVGPANLFSPEGQSWSDLANGTSGFQLINNQMHFRAHHNNWSFYGQDTWKATRRLTLTYGVRWDINPAPTSDTPGLPLYSLGGVFDSGPYALTSRPMWNTQWSAFAPRIGAAYQLTPKTVLRGGFGLFHDLGFSGLVGQGFPYSQETFTYNTVTMDFSNPAYTPPAFTTTITPSSINISVVDPNMKAPLTYQWNVAVERQLGKNQTLTASYVGSAGTELARMDSIRIPGSGGYDYVTHNGGSSRFNSAQFKYMARMGRSLQAQISYVRSRSTDNNSSDVNGMFFSNISQLVIPSRALSDYDVPNAFSAMVSYSLPTPAWGGKVGKAIIGGWGLDDILKIQSGTPLSVTAYEGITMNGTKVYNSVIEDLVPGQPIWIPDSSQPAGKVLNPAAFAIPTPYGGTLYGTSGRNSIRSPYGISETDFAIRRQFSITERVKLNLRMEYFNLFNHPMFSPSALGTTQYYCINSALCFNEANFGSVQVGTNFTANGTGWDGGGQNSLYMLGGSRSGQISLKLSF